MAWVYIGDFPKTYTSDILKFYLGEKGDYRSLRDIRYFNNDQMEFTHDYIQWLFPSTEISKYNALAPVLTKKDIEYFLECKSIRVKVRHSVHQFMLFLYNTKYNWCCEFNHNHLRISRMLKFLMLINMKAEAKYAHREILDIISDMNCDEQLINSKIFWENIINQEKQ